MSVAWTQAGREKRVTAPVSLNVTAFAPVADIRKTLTPPVTTIGRYIAAADRPGNGEKTAWAGPSLSQVTRQSGLTTSDLDDPTLLAACFHAVQLLNETGYLLAYHDRSDGGVFATLCEMAFAGRCGMDIDTGSSNLKAFLFNEEPGIVLQVRSEHARKVLDTLLQSGLPETCLLPVARPNGDNQVRIRHRDQEVYSAGIDHLHRLWSLTTYHMQSLRDNPACAAEEFEVIQDLSDPGLSSSFPDFRSSLPRHILRQGLRWGSCGNRALTAMWRWPLHSNRAGFDCIDINMNDLLSGSASLAGLAGLVACGGFSYGDVLGAGGGWAKSILYNDRLRDEFEQFFKRADSFGLGVCNGCQMLSRLRGVSYPGAAHWPDFERNRFRTIRIPCGHGRGHGPFPFPVHAGHGRVPGCPSWWPTERGAWESGVNHEHSLPVLRFIDNHGEVTDTYPYNPNGSAGGLTGFTNDDGRFTILMPHPERVFLKQQMSWIDHDQPGADSPWMQMFYNARKWVD